MTAFDTSTNTGSTTFTHSWGTVDLLPSATVQKAGGFKRTSGWRYFECYVDDKGGDSSRLFMGVSTPLDVIGGGIGYVVGGDNKGVMIAGGTTFNPAYPYTGGNATTSLTVCTGDTFMFAVDMTGNGRYHDGTSAAGTLTSGGEILTSCIVEVGRNGTWNSAVLVTFAWPSHGYPMQVRPWVARDSTSASFARVSLRVETASFVYAIPTGMVAWADGPEGGASISASTMDVHWDPATIGSDQTLTNSNYQHNLVSAGSTLSAVSVKSTALPTTGKRVVEFWGFQNATSSQTASSTGSGKVIDMQYDIGLCDAAMASISWSANGTIAQPDIAWIVGSGMKRRRTVNVSSSMTQVQTFLGSQLYQTHQTLYIDFDSLRLWERRGLGSANALTNGHWSGRTISNSDGPDPYAGRDGHTISASGSGTFRLIAVTTKNYTSGHWIYMNVGQTAFETYPLLPGWTSMDGSRFATGVGAVWDTSVMPSSISVCYSGLGVRRYDRTSDCVLVRGTTKKNSGKWFFNIFAESEATVGTLSALMGLIPDTVATFTAVSNASFGAVGIFYSPFGSINANRTQNTHRFRYGVTTSYTQSMTMTSASVPVGSNAWYGCAVDFDLGHIWFGSWNPNRRQIAWHQGADPATDTNPDLTFTASTTMYIAITPTNDTVGGAKGWWYLVAESANVIGAPSGFTPWNGTTTESTTATPSAAVPTTTASGALRVLWPYGVQT